MKVSRSAKLKKRHVRVRKKVNGTAERPRVVVRKSLKHLYVNVVDDSDKRGARTLGTYTTAAGDKRGKHQCNVAGAEELGKVIGADLKKKGIENIVFDRGGYRYHGCVKTIADQLREAGLQF